jgi:membrane protein
MQMLTIEHTFNALWKVRAPRPWLRRVAIHGVALVAGPLMFGAALASITYLAGVSFGFFDEPRWVRIVFAQLLPVAFLALLLGLLYWAVPNRSVSRWHAGVAGLLAALAFAGMQRLFALYIVKLPTYAAIYGTFAALPVFLLWLHLSWSVILIGALLVAEWPSARR